MSRDIEVADHSLCIKNPRLFQHFVDKSTHRPIDQLWNHGLILFDKPIGTVSHHITHQIKQLFRNTPVDKIGHGGTLDPNATGLLPLTLNNATIIQDILLSGTKEYLATMHLHSDRTETDVRNVFQYFVGPIYQRPPDRSAVSREIRIREISAIDLVSIQNRDVVFRVNCDAGTYIRKLCVDLGEVLECGAHLTQLRRTRSGSLSEQDGLVSLVQIDSALTLWDEKKNPADLLQIIRPKELAFQNWSKVFINEKAYSQIVQRKLLSISDIVAFSHGIQKQDPVAIFSLENEILGHGISMMNSVHLESNTDGNAVKIVRSYKICD